jgi:hypothetical protein
MKWRAAWKSGSKFNDLDADWQVVLNNRGEPLAWVNRNGDLQQALMKLVAAADEAFDGVGAIIEDGDPKDAFLSEAAIRLQAGSLSTIHWTRLSFPKCTLRRMVYLIAPSR